MKLLIVIVLLGLFGYAFATKFPLAPVNRELCLRTAEKLVDRHYLSSIKFRDKEQKQLIFEECQEFYRFTPVIEVIPQLLGREEVAYQFEEYL